MKAVIPKSKDTQTSKKKILLNLSFKEERKLEFVIVSFVTRVVASHSIDHS